MKLPVGTTRIYLQTAHSLKMSSGFSAHSSVIDSTAARRDEKETVAPPLPQPPHQSG